MTRALRPPQGGAPPPEEAWLDEAAAIPLRPIATEVCRRYRAEYPDEEARYGDAGIDWCIHDNQHIVNWAILSLREGDELLEDQVAWLARVLAARGFPLDRLERNLELAAEVLREVEPRASAAADALERARPAVRAA